MYIRLPDYMSYELIWHMLFPIGPGYSLINKKHWFYSEQNDIATLKIKGLKKKKTLQFWHDS